MKRTEIVVTTITNVLLSSVVIAKRGNKRIGFIIFNNSTNSVYVTLADTSVATNCTRLIPTFASWEMMGEVCYSGVISAIRNAGSGAVTVFELTE